MQTLGDILTFIKANGRISSTDENSLLVAQVNESYLRLARKKPWPSLRTLGTLTTVQGQQNYNLPANFDRLYENSIRYDTGNPSPQWAQGWVLPIVSGPDAEVWEALWTRFAPGAVRIVEGTGGLKALRLMPYFDATPVQISFVYYKKPAVLVNDADILEVTDLCEAIAWDVLNSQRAYSRDDSMMSFFADRAKRSYYSAMSTLQQ